MRARLDILPYRRLFHTHQYFSALKKYNLIRESVCSPLVFAFGSSGCDEQNVGGQSADGAPVLGMKASHCVPLTKDPFHMNQAIQLRDVTIWICNFLSTKGLYLLIFE